MISILLPSFFIFIFGFFSLLGINPQIARQQFINFAIGFVVFYIIRKFGRKFIISNAQFFFFLFTLLLLITYIIGFEVKGSKRWIDLYFFNFQSSEFLKVFFILYLSQLFVKLSNIEYTFRRLALLLLMLLIPSFIVFKQPDLGNAIVYVYLFFILLFFLKISKKYIVSIISFLFLIVSLLVVFLKDYQKNRILSFFSLYLEQQGNAYNMIQAMITVGSGKWFGKGLGLSTQSRLFFLPENKTDFAFSTLIEQFGFFGGFIVLVLYLVLFFFLFKRITLLLKKNDDESKIMFLYVLGIFSYIFFQMFVNIGMNLGVLPIAGIALPFISSGGSLIVTLFLGFALIP